MVKNRSVASDFFPTRLRRRFVLWVNRVHRHPLTKLAEVIGVGIGILTGVLVLFEKQADIEILQDALADSLRQPFSAEVGDQVARAVVRDLVPLLEGQALAIESLAKQLNEEEPNDDRAATQTFLEELAARLANNNSIGSSKSVNLTGANLKGADLTGANFVGLVLVKTNFSGANLSFADFRASNITGASFVGANVTGVNFQGAQGFKSSALKGACVSDLNAQPLTPTSMKLKSCKKKF